MSALVDKIKDKVSGNSSQSEQHLAAILTSKGSPLEVIHCPTPTPGPSELLIEVKAVALNPVDYHMRDTGMLITKFPAVLGSDIAGTVVSAGSAVDSDAPKPGARIAGFATAFYARGEPDYGAFQTCVLVPAANVVPLPDSMSFNEASLLPMSVATAWNGWYSIGVPRDTAYTAADKKGMLVWGGASSVGSGAVQVAKLMGYHVYVTASEKHHEYMRSLGATRTFDYKSQDVVKSIVRVVKEDGVVLQTAFDAVGQLEYSMEVMNELREGATAKVASASLIKDDSPKIEGVEATFVQAPSDGKAREENFHFIFRVWLKEKLASGEFVPSPKIKVVGKGLESLQAGLDELKNLGASGVKLVVEL